MDTDPTVNYMRLTGRWWDLDINVEVERAVGMVATQLDCPDHDAATILRAHAAAHAEDPVDTTSDILDGKLIFRP